MGGALWLQLVLLCCLLLAFFLLHANRFLLNLTHRSCLLVHLPLNLFHSYQSSRGIFLLSLQPFNSLSLLEHRPLILSQSSQVTLLLSLQPLVRIVLWSLQNLLSLSPSLLSLPHQVKSYLNPRDWQLSPASLITLP